MIGPQHPLLGVSGGPWVLRENEEVDLLYPLGSLVCEVGEILSVLLGDLCRQVGG